MNLILLFENDFIANNLVRLADHRLKHIQSVLKSQHNDTLIVGMLNEKKGTGIIQQINKKEILIKVSLTDHPPQPLPVKLILAIPRPKALRRILQHVTAFGVKEIYLIRSWRVQKSYLESPALQPDKIAEQAILGLEQAKDTIMPTITIKTLFRPFIEDELPEIIRGTTPLLAHPSSTSNRFTTAAPATIAIGPEGGFIPFEVSLFEKQGFKKASLGPRPLKVESAVSALLGRFLQ